MKTTDTMEAAKTYNHAIGHDQDVYDLRLKYYAKSVATTPTETPLPEALVVLDEAEAGISFKCLTHPCSYFSSSLPHTENWNLTDWKEYFKVFSASRNWDLARLLMISNEQLEQLQSLCKKKLLPTFVKQEQIRVINGNQDWNSYVGSRSASFNRNQRRCHRNMEKSGFTYTKDFSTDEILELFSRRSDLGHAKKIGADDYTVSPQFVGFTRELRDRFEARGLWFQSGVRDAAGRLSACAFGMFDKEGAFYIFQTAHDPALRHLRLGYLAFEKLIEDLLSRGVTFISFMGDSSYIHDFTSDTYNFNRLDIHNHTRTGMLLYARRWGSKAKKIAKSVRRYLVISKAVTLNSIQKLIQHLVRRTDHLSKALKMNLKPKNSIQ